MDQVNEPKLVDASHEEDKDSANDFNTSDDEKFEQKNIYDYKSHRKIKQYL